MLHLDHFKLLFIPIFTLALSEVNLVLGAISGLGGCCFVWLKVYGQYKDNKTKKSDNVEY